jgi:hypothetical protein
MPRRPLCSLAFTTATAGVLALAAVMACGSSSQPASSGAQDGGNGSEDRTVPAETGTDGSSASDGAVETGNDPVAAAYCEAAFGALARCGVISSACAAVLLSDGGADCALYASVYSDAYMQATQACGYFSVDCSCFTSTCSDAGDTEESAAEACVIAKLAQVAPSAEDDKVRSDFCAACPDSLDNVPACAGFYYFADAGLVDANLTDAGVTGSLGFGSELLELSPALTTEVDQQCTGPALLKVDAGQSASCYEQFLQCIRLVADGAQPDGGAMLPAACLDAGASEN